MITIPKSEKDKFVAIVNAQAQTYGLTPEEYLKKVWYHEQAAKMGEFIAMSLVDQLLPVVSTIKCSEDAAAALPV